MDKPTVKVMLEEVEAEINKINAEMERKNLCEDKMVVDVGTGIVVPGVQDNLPPKDRYVQAVDSEGNPLGEQVAPNEMNNVSVKAGEAIGAEYHWQRLKKQAEHSKYMTEAMNKVERKMIEMKSIRE